MSTGIEPRLQYYFFLQYEDGTIFTISAKNVKKQIIQAPKRQATRSRSRGRSPGRKAKPRKAAASPASSPETKPKTPSKPKTPKVATPAVTPTRVSKRIAQRVALAEMSPERAEKKKKLAKATSSIIDFISGTKYGKYLPYPIHPKCILFYGS